MSTVALLFRTWVVQYLDVKPLFFQYSIVPDRQDFGLLIYWRVLFPQDAYASWCLRELRPGKGQRARPPDCFTSIKYHAWYRVSHDVDGNQTDDEHYTTIWLFEAQISLYGWFGWKYFLVLASSSCRGCTWIDICIRGTINFISSIHAIFFSLSWFSVVSCFPSLYVSVSEHFPVTYLTPSVTLGTL